MLRLADNAYQPKGNRTAPRSPVAAGRAAGYAHPGKLLGRRTARRCSGGPEPGTGHIATYVGNGVAVTNMPGGKVKKIN